ncbi:hypothetical protein [Myroides odoratus]|uniref:Uncharacterized protein n=1 Tax=Myroides odoratus TaxID=256 RepID=A0A378U5B0_MYROD|nr:hypothetical protein [Myroides odoratus]QQU02594.1 hypothetical protein I6I89_12245 [Myroides odoratus]STZ70191.1 Uncharacterised protein [Myroides odoratus]
MGQVHGSRTIRLRERINSVRIQATGTQFQGNTPANLTLKAVPYNFTAVSYAWYKGTGTTAVGTNQNLIVANTQVAAVETYRVVVKNNQNQEYEDVISISKVIDGAQGRPGQLPIQREWKVGEVYRNNDDVVDYIYHRITDSWWKLKGGYNNVAAQENPTNEFIRLNAMEQLAVNILIAENANIAGFVFKDQKMISQSPSLSNPNLSLDGVNGELKVMKGQVGEFTINEGLEYNKQGLRFVSNMLKTYQKFFRFDRNGLKLINNDWYSGAFCGQNENGFSYCAGGDTHSVKFEIETGGVDYYLKIFSEGKYRQNEYKGALWIQAVSSTIDAILIEKGGVTLKKGDINIYDGNYRADGMPGATGTIAIGSVKIKVNKGIITGW